MIEARHEASVDAFIGGRVEAEQPLLGHHRAGLEAVLIAAAVPRHATGTVVDLGAGAGVAGFCVAARCPGASILLVERDASLVAAMRSSLARPANAGFAARVHVVETDIAAAETAREAAGLMRDSADIVIMNPPFHAEGKVRKPAGDARAAAHLLDADGLDPWFRAAASVLRPGGLVIAIFPAAGLQDLLAAAASRFGALDLLPIHPRSARPAIRLVLRGRKGRKGGMTIRPGLTLHEAEGNRYLPAVDAVLRSGADLAAAAPGWPADPD
jgi:tRNA1(Val) A37 N6-methylase TrmN6